MAYRLGLDIGTNSIGWCLVDRLDGGGGRIKNIGVRIFSDGRDPKSRTSLAVERRIKRAMRRSRDRRVRRRTKLLKLLVEFGLMPVDKTERKALEAVNPYIVRAAALDSKLPLHQVGRALFHINQRRGFKSNRKTDKGDQEAGKIALGVSKLRSLMDEEKARTFGEFLAKRLARGECLRVRMRDGEGPTKASGEAMEGYAFYPDRALLEDEFQKIWKAQAEHYSEALTPERFKALFDCIFYQRPLKSPEIGLCTLLGSETKERRLPKSDPLFQRRRLLEELNGLTIERGPGTKPERLTIEQRDKLLMEIQGKREVAFSTLRKRLKLGDAVFNKERGGREKLLGDEVFAELSHKDRFGSDWSQFSLERQREIVAILRDEQDGEKLVDWLIRECGLDEARARRVAGARLPEGYGRFGETATQALIRELRTAGPDGRVIVYSEAVERAPELGHHSDFRAGKRVDQLPYYGEVLERHIIPGTGDPADDLEKRVGKVTNPTVHIGLNQLRRVMNAIIRRYGHPDEIVIELARDLKLSDEQRREIQARQKRDEQDAIRRGQKLEELNQPNTGANRALLKLWEELNPYDPLDRRCIYTGTVISPSMLFNGQADIDHILPWSKTLDDGNANKLVCMAGANRAKRNRSPAEAWQGTPEWEAILQRAARLPREKARRFNPDAMDRFAEEKGFLARHLVDTRHLSKLAKQYLELIAPDRVWVSTGRLTALLRRHWGLNSLLPDHNYAATVHEKNRKDHRHHAIDAAVMSVMSLSLLQRISHEAGQRERQGVDDVIGIIPQPWQGFREELSKALNRVVVSHRADHGTIGGRPDEPKQQTAGGLHNETAYGLTGETDAAGNSLVVHRLPLSSLKPSHLADVGTRIRDPHLRKMLRNATQGLSGKEFVQAVFAFARDHVDFRGMRRVRVIEPLSVIEIKDGEGRAYKGYKGDANYRYDVWRLPDGKWKADVISMFDAHNPKGERPIKCNYPTAKKVMRLHRDDLVRFEDAERGDGIARIVKFDQSGNIYLAQHNEAGALKERDAAPNDEDPFKYFKAAASRLKKAKVRQIRVDELGRVWDPGFKE